MIRPNISPMAETWGPARKTIGDFGGYYADRSGLSMLFEESCESPGWSMVAGPRHVVRRRYSSTMIRVWRLN
jgi:hypothetical protein